MQKLSSLLLTASALALLMLSCNPKQGSQSTAPAEEVPPKTEEELAERVITKVQRILENTEERLATVDPIADTMPAELGLQQGRALKLWMENEKAVKLSVTEPDAEGKMTRQSTFYFAGPDLFYAEQPFARFIFMNGELEYWLDENWQVNQMSEQALDQREAYLYDEANEYLSWFFGGQ